MMLTFQDVYSALPAAEAFSRRELSNRVALQVALWRNKLLSVGEELDRERLSVLKKYAKLDEEGALVMGDAGQAKFPDEESREAYATAWTALLAAPANVELPALSLSVGDLPDVIPAFELAALLRLGVSIEE